MSHWISFSFLVSVKGFRTMCPDGVRKHKVDQTWFLRDVAGRDVSIWVSFFPYSGRNSEVNFIWLHTLQSAFTFNLRHVRLRPEFHIWKVLSWVSQCIVYIWKPVALKVECVTIGWLSDSYSEPEGGRRNTRGTAHGISLLAAVSFLAQLAMRLAVQTGFSGNRGDFCVFTTSTGPGSAEASWISVTLENISRKFCRPSFFSTRLSVNRCAKAVSCENSVN